MLQIVHFLAFPVIHLQAAFRQLLDCPVFISFHLLQEHSCTCFVFHCSSEDMEGKNTAALGWVHPTMPISIPSKGLAKVSSYSYGLYLVTPGKLASTKISKPDFKCIKIWLQPRTTASPTASTILLKSPTQNHPVVFANSHSLVWR